MGTFYFFCVLLVGQVFDLSEAVPNYFDDADFQRHIIYFGKVLRIILYLQSVYNFKSSEGPKSTLGPKPAGPRITGKSLANGCRTKPVENFALLGTARACPAKKPIKLTKALKMGKHLCASDWHVCTITDKAVQKLSWKTTKMPRGCFAFIYG